MSELYVGLDHYICRRLRMPVFMVQELYRVTTGALGGAGKTPEIKADPGRFRLTRIRGGNRTVRRHGPRSNPCT